MPEDDRVVLGFDFALDGYVVVVWGVVRGFISSEDLVRSEGGLLVPRMRPQNPPLQQVPRRDSNTNRPFWHDPRTSEDPEPELADPESAFERRVKLYVLGGKNAVFQSPDRLGKDEYIWFVDKYYLEITTRPPKPGEETGSFLGYRYIGEPPQWWLWAVARERVTETLVKDFDGYGYLVHRDAARNQRNDEEYYREHPPYQELLDAEGFVIDTEGDYNTGYYYNGSSMDWSWLPWLSSPA